nr:hypothetical protein [Tanacetum cinerariifolium]
MNHGFLDAKGRNNNHRKKKTMNTGTCLSLGSDGIQNDATPSVDAAMKVVSPSVVKETVSMECHVVNTSGVGPNPSLHTQKANATVGNASGEPSYANDTGKPSGKKVNIRALYTPGGNGIDVVKLYGVPMMAFNEDGLSAIATKLGRSSYARVMIELLADVDLKDNIVVAMPKINKEGHYTCAGEKKTVKKPSQASRGASVGPKIGFKPKKEYRLVTKKPNANSSGNKKKGMEATIEVSNSNSFDVLNSVDNDVEVGTNGGTTNLVNNEATSSGSSFMNIDNDGEFARNTPIGEKIEKIERQICEGKLRLLDNDGNPLVPTGIVDSDSEVEVVFDETANLRISTSGKNRSDNSYGTNSLLEQWRDSYPNNDNYDPYDDDMYKNHCPSTCSLFVMILISRSIAGRRNIFFDVC